MKNLKQNKGAVTTPTEAEQDAIVGGAEIDEVASRLDDPLKDLAQVKRQRGKRRVGPGDPPQGF
ncbi:MAG: hypothetical protein U0359_02890 [Byssovorax sp.]